MDKREDQRLPGEEAGAVLGAGLSPARGGEGGGQGEGRTATARQQRRHHHLVAEMTNQNPKRQVSGGSECTFWLT